jgi:hypothetical protein
VKQEGNETDRTDGSLGQEKQNADDAWDRSLPLGDVGPRRVYLVEVSTKFDQPAESPQTFNYVGEAGR